MGALSGALKGVIAQRLVRRLCEACCQPVALADLPTTHQALLAGRRAEKLRRAVGCEACRGTGYRGRMVVTEVLLVNDEIRSVIARHADRVELVELAKRSGMISVFEAGLWRVLEGLTALPELVDNVPTPLMDATAGQPDVDALVDRLTGRDAGAAGERGAPAAPVTTGGTGGAAAALAARAVSGRIWS